MKNKTQEKLENLFIEIIKENIKPSNKMSDEDFILLLEQCKKDGTLPY